MLVMCCTVYAQLILEGEMDLMAPSDDITEQRPRLTNTHTIEIVYQSYGHMDFVSFPVHHPSAAPHSCRHYQIPQRAAGALSEPRAIQSLFLQDKA